MHLDGVRRVAGTCAGRAIDLTGVIGAKAAAELITARNAKTNFMAAGSTWSLAEPRLVLQARFFLADFSRGERADITKQSS